MIYCFIKFNTVDRDLKTISTKIIGYPNIYCEGIKIYSKRQFIIPSTDHECDPQSKIALYTNKIIKKYYLSNIFYTWYFF